jgi:hypothetical protein
VWWLRELCLLEPFSLGSFESTNHCTDASSVHNSRSVPRYNICPSGQLATFSPTCANRALTRWRTWNTHHKPSLRERRDVQMCSMGYRNKVRNLWKLAHLFNENFIIFHINAERAATYVPSWHESNVFLVAENEVLSGDKSCVNLLTPQIKTRWNGSLGC